MQSKPAVTAVLHGIAGFGGVKLAGFSTTKDAVSSNNKGDSFLKFSNL
jgi:hypothetical protein